MMNGADLIARILKKEGVELLPAFPHSDLIEAAARAGIRPLIVRQERQALHIADGYARMTGGRRLACSTVQHGPGSENAFGAVAQCHADNVPLLHIPGGYPRRAQGLDAHFSAARSMQHVNKWCAMVLDPARLPQMLQNAFALLRNGRPGPVTLEVPGDIFAAEVSPALLEGYRPQRRSAPVAAAGEVRELVDMLLAARRPAIVAGQGILYAGAWDELLALAEVTQTPVMTTLNGKSAFPENHPLALGCAGASRPGQLLHFLERADLLMGLGTSFTRSEYITPFPTGGRVFAQLTNWEGDISKDYPIDLGVIGDARPSLAAMAAEAAAPPRPGGRRGEGAVAEEIARARRDFMASWRPLLASDERPVNPYRVIADIMATVDRRRTVVTHDAGSPRDQTTAFYEAIVPHGYMGWGKTTQLGLGLGLMQGAKLAKPDWDCINIMGDAAIGMVGMDLETGVRNAIGTTTVVLKNSVMGGYVDHHPTASAKHRIHELGGDYAALARALGAHGERVTDPAAFAPALERALACNREGRPSLIEVVSADEARMAKDLPDASHAMWQAPLDEAPPPAP